MTKYKRIDDIKTFENMLKEHFQKDRQNELAEIKYSDKERRKIFDKMNSALKYSKIKTMVGKINIADMTFSQNLYDFRTKNKLTKTDMKRILGIDVSLIDDIESGKKRIDSLDEKIIAKVLSKLRITVNQYVQLLRNEIKAGAVKGNSIQAFARSKSTLSVDDRSKKMQHGIDAVMLEISKRKNNLNQIEIDKEHIEKIKKHLIKLGENVLLK